MDLTKIKLDLSKNYGTRGSNKITHIILHCPIGTDAGSLATLKNTQTPNKVSAHYLILRDGTPIQLVPLEYAAWHAMHQPNLWSIGIEIVDRYFISGQLQPGCMSDKHWLTNLQLTNLADLVATLMQKFNIPLSNVMGHNDPWLRQFGNNHQDPGPYFPWRDFRVLVSNKLKFNQALEYVSQTVDMSDPKWNDSPPPIKWNPLKKNGKSV